MTQDLNQYSSAGRSIVYLLGLTFASSLGVQLLVLLLGYLLSGNLDNSLMTGNQHIAGVEGPFYMYLLLMSSSLATFLFPVLILRRFDSTPFLFDSSAKSPKLLYLLSALFLVAFGPIMQIIGEWNAQLSLPTIFQELEEWMKMKEEEMAMLTERIVMTDQMALLLLNILVMAVVPALVEEYYFRGALLPIIKRWCGNKHIAIWLVAIIFSAIHVQFYGFFPRMILGVVFGYMFVWTGNIWVAVLAHFVNNATVAVLAFVYARQGKTYADLQSYENYSIFVYLGSLILATVIAYYFYRLTNKDIDGKKLD